MNTHMTMASDENTTGAIEEPTCHSLLVAAGPIPASSGFQARRCVEVAPPRGIVPVHCLTAAILIAQALAGMQPSEIGLMAHASDRWPSAIVIFFTCIFGADRYPQGLAQRS
eukprot:Skav208441  [mRNA]  locus=scaffold1952:175062:177287:+ [translate_table: standard]